MAHNARWCHSCGWSAHYQCGYIVSLQWRPRLVLCPPGGLLQLWPVVYATMCTSHFIVIFVLHCIQWFCTIALYFHLVFSLFVVCWYPYIFIDVLPCTLMFLCEIRAIKISYSYSYSHTCVTRPQWVNGCNAICALCNMVWVNLYIQELQKIHYCVYWCTGAFWC